MDFFPLSLSLQRSDYFISQNNHTFWRENLKFPEKHVSKSNFRVKNKNKTKRINNSVVVNRFESH